MLIINQSVAVFTEDVNKNIDLIEKIKYFFSHPNNKDFVIFSNNPCSAQIGCLHSVISSFYIIGYRGLLIFLNLDDYFQYKDTVLADTAIYMESIDDSVDRNTIKNSYIITDKDNRLVMDKTYGL